MVSQPTVCKLRARSGSEQKEATMRATENRQVFSWFGDEEMQHGIGWAREVDFDLLVSEDITCGN